MSDERSGPRTMSERLPQLADPSRRGDLLQHLFDVSPLGMLITSAAGRFIEVNPRMESMLGYPREELLGRRFADITHADDQELGQSALKQLLAGEIRSADLEKRYIRRDGAIVWVALHVTTLLDDDAMLFLVYVEDITERRRQQDALLESERRLRGTLDALPDAILRVDGDGRILEYKPGADVGHAIPARVFAGMRLRDVLPPGASAAIAASDAGSTEFEHAFVGSERAYEVQWTPFGSDQRLVIVRDATERKRASAERVQQQEIIRIQRDTLRRISAPLMPIADGVVAVPLIGPVDQERVASLVEVLLAGVVSQRARVVILDVTGVSAIDAPAAAELLRAAHGVRLLGAEMVISGINPEAAQHFVELGVDMGALKTIGRFQGAIAYALSRSRPRPTG